MVRFIKLILFSQTLLLCFSCGDSGSAQSAMLSRKDVEVNRLKDLVQNDVLTTTSFDVYIDFSSTMKWGIKDPVFQNAVRHAVDNRGDGLVIRIGENKDVESIDNDATTINNTVFNVAEYNEMLTIIEPQLSRLVENQSPAVIFSDFSIDEGVPQSDFDDDIKSNYIRDSRYSPLFQKWFMLGGDVRVFINENSDNPIFVILFIPVGSEGVFAGLEKDFLPTSDFSRFDFSSDLFGLQRDFVDQDYLLDPNRLSNKSQNLTTDDFELVVFGSWSKNYFEKYRNKKLPLLTGISTIAKTSIEQGGLIFETMEVIKSADGSLKMESLKSNMEWFSLIREGNNYEIVLNDQLRPLEFERNRLFYLQYNLAPKEELLESAYSEISAAMDYSLKSGKGFINNDCLSESLVKGYRDFVKSRMETDAFPMGGTFIFFNK